ncbi:hypothetical protein [Candidatus Symbiopectobacterium sp.]|uniref:hypothetical protein n=1 Tax=Candidatus Symbiopectobacterium sp. TaxID=2816440 RepID=UPI0025C3965B|nr:hypothetical protein [Candidatus Symbiopectobacterium sp.]
MVICSDDYPKVLFIQQSHLNGETQCALPASRNMRSTSYAYSERQFGIYPPAFGYGDNSSST